MSATAKTLLLLMAPILLGFAGPVPFLSWPQMENVEFAEKFVKEVDGYMLFPKFTEPLKKLAGKPVIVEGYVVPVDKSGSFEIISNLP